MKAYVILPIIALCGAAFAQVQPQDVPYSIFERNRSMPPGPDNRVGRGRGPQLDVFTPIFVGVIKDDAGMVGYLQGENDVTTLRVGDTLAWNRLKIVDLSLTRMLLSDNTAIPIGNDLLNRPHYLPAAPLSTSAAPATPSGRSGRRGNVPTGDFPGGTTNPLNFGRGRGNFGANGTGTPGLGAGTFGNGTGFGRGGAGAAPGVTPETPVPDAGPMGR